MYCSLQMCSQIHWPCSYLQRFRNSTDSKGLHCYNPIHLINWFQTLVYFDFVVRVTARKSTNLISPMVDATLGSVTNAYVTHIHARTRSSSRRMSHDLTPARVNATRPVDKPLLQRCSQLKETLDNDKSSLRTSNWQLTTTVKYFSNNQIWFFLITLFFLIRFTTEDICKELSLMSLNFLCAF